MIPLMLTKPFQFHRWYTELNLSGSEYWAYLLNLNNMLMLCGNCRDMERDVSFVRPLEKEIIVHRKRIFPEFTVYINQ